MTLAQARKAYDRQAWSEAFDAYAEADAEAPLEPADLESFAHTAHLLGRVDDGVLMERAHHEHLQHGDEPAAARCAFWMGMALMNRGEFARGGGWLGRAQRLVADVDCVERGYLLIPQALGQLGEDAEAAHALFTQAVAVAERFADPDLTAMGRLGQGQSLINLGRASHGLALLDEVMVAIGAAEVSAVPTGIVYCACISACQDIGDLQRAREWTAALSAWCEAHPDMVPFQGQCLVHRSQILQLGGAWALALSEAEQACERFGDNHPAIGDAHYQRGELHRLRGELAQAEEAYRAANALGYSPLPGIALLRLAQGRPQVARPAMQRVLQERQAPAARVRLLAAAAEIALASDDVAAARAASDELTALAAQVGIPALSATADHVAGAVALVEGDVPGAVDTLRQAANLWRELGAPFESARARVLIGVACRQHGDLDSAGLEFDAARSVFTELGAQPELERLDRLMDGDGAGARPSALGLTDREVEVLRLIAAGKSNAAIAEALVISTHTVARHVQNIFTKLDVSSRTAAAAVAFAHDLA